MLETTFATTFALGSNVKGTAAGASWIFLLPRLDYRHILYVGVPSTSTLATLARLGRQVTIVCRDHAQAQLVAVAGATVAASNLVTIMDADAASLPNQSVDLMVVGVPGLLKRGGARKRLVALAQQTLAADGLVYFECRGPIERFCAGLLARALADGHEQVQQFWLTPSRGEVQTGLPAMSQEMIDYFFQRRLYASAVDPHVVNVVKQLLVKRRRNGQGAASPKLTVVRKPSKGLRRQMRVGAARTGLRLVRLMQDAEWLITKHGAALWRYGVLVSPGQSLEIGAPPAYLQDIAAGFGIDLHEHRWAISAPGEYSSRKVVVLLFAPGQTTPQYVVKMTRDARYNARLENEYQTLTLLEEYGLPQQGDAPGVAFFGHHGNLAIVGETAVEGVPFASRTRLTADCPVLHAALDNLTAMAERTAQPDAVAPSEVAQGLQVLFDQFVEIYHPLPAHRAFLQQQITQLGQSRERLPLVFQHGDPGTWNVLVTEGDHAVFIDWEAAEPNGLPLWDVFYFLRAYSGDVARVRGVQNRLQGFAQLFLDETELSRMLEQVVDGYCARVGLARELVAPLFFTCWMHRALKESTRLVAARLNNGLYISLLRLCIDQREAAPLRRIFGAPADARTFGAGA